MEDELAFDDVETFEDIEEIIEDDPLDLEDVTNEIYDIETSDIQKKEKEKKKIKKSEEEDDEDEEEEEEEEDEEEEDEEEDGEEFLSVERKKLFETEEQYEEDPYSTIYVVKSEDRITSEYMTIYEYAMVIGTRATHISKGAPIFTTIDHLDDPREIAKKEINEGKCPLNITRRLRNSNKIEMWTVNEMIKPYNI